METQRKYLNRKARLVSFKHLLYLGMAYNLLIKHLQCKYCLYDGPVDYYDQAAGSSNSCTVGRCGSFTVTTHP